MKLQTQIPLEKIRYHQIGYDSNIFLIGSCFSENIGKKFDYYKFQNAVNPFGILFNPVAIENLITRTINLEYYTNTDLGQNNEGYYSFDAHSQLNTLDADTVLTKLNSGLDLSLSKMKEASHVIITLGTSWVYRHVATDKLVANCHKVPQKQFQKELLSVDDIANSLEAIIDLVKSVNNAVSFIFTVSPVRHIKDGFVENTLSKSHLFAGVHQVVDPKNAIYYFPSYEIMMDELRDYRFYSEDMIHPSNVAIDFIWNRFSESWISNLANKTMEEISEVQKGLNHRPFNPNSDAHKKFQSDLKQKITKLQEQFPHIFF